MTPGLGEREYEPASIPKDLDDITIRPGVQLSAFVEFFACGESRRGLGVKHSLRWLLPIVAISIVLGVATPSLRGYFHDEGSTFDHAVGRAWCDNEEPLPSELVSRHLDGQPGRSAAGVVETLIGFGFHPPAYYLLIHSWTGVAGTGFFGVRLPGLLFGVLSIVGFALLARRVVVQPHAAFVAALLATLSYWHVHMLAILRPYGMSVCLVVWSTWAAVGIGQSEELRLECRRWALFAIASVLGIYSIYHYAFVLVWQFAMLGLLIISGETQRRVRDLGILFGVGLFVIVCYAPWFPGLAAHLERTSHGIYAFGGRASLADYPHLLGKWLEMFLFVDSPAKLWARDFATGLGLASAGLLIVALVRMWRSTESRRLPIFWLSLPLLPGTILLADLWQNTQTLFMTKTTFGVFPLLLLAVVLAITSLPRRLMGVGLLAWSLLLGATTGSALMQQRNVKNNFEAVASWVARSDQPSHVVLFSSSSRGFVQPFLRELRDAGAEQVHVACGLHERLPQVVAKLIEDERFDRITLVNLRANYLVFANRWPRQATWTAIGTAKSSGWKVETPKITRRGIHIYNPPAAEEQLTVFPSVRVDFFAQ